MSTNSFTVQPQEEMVCDQNNNSGYKKHHSPNHQSDQIYDLITTPDQNHISGLKKENVVQQDKSPGTTNFKRNKAAFKRNDRRQKNQTMTQQDLQKAVNDSNTICETPSGNNMVKTCENSAQNTFKRGNSVHFSQNQVENADTYNTNTFTTNAKSPQTIKQQLIIEDQNSQMFSSEQYGTPANNHNNQSTLQYSQGRDKVRIDWSVQQSDNNKQNNQDDIAANSQQQTLKRKNLHNNRSPQTDDQATAQQSRKEMGTLKREITKLQRKLQQMEDSKKLEIEQAVKDTQTQLRSQFDDKIAELEEENQIIQESKIETVTSDLKVQFDSQLQAIQTGYQDQMDQVNSRHQQELQEKDAYIQLLQSDMDKALQKKEQEIEKLNGQLQSTLVRPSTVVMGDVSERVIFANEKRLQSPKNVVSKKLNQYSANIELSKSNRKKKVLELSTKQNTLSQLNVHNFINPSGHHTSPNRKTPKQLLQKFVQPSKSPAIFRQSFEQEPTKRIDETNLYPTINPNKRHKFEQIQMVKSQKFDEQEYKQQMFSAVRETVEEQNGASENAVESGYNQESKSSWNSSECSAIDDLEEESKNFTTLSKAINCSYMNLKRYNLDVVHATHKVNPSF